MGSPQRSVPTTSSSRRAQSETLGFVLVFSIMLLGALVVVGLGATAISDTEEEISQERAEHALTQFDAKSSLVALGEADSQRMRFANDDENNFRVRENQGWMNVTVENLTDGHEEEIMNVTLGALEYDGGSNKLAYQGGGVWRQTDNGGQMVSPPEFHFRNGTLTLPAINVSGSFDLGSTVDITQGNVDRTFPEDGYANFTNPLDNHLVQVTVKSGYYRGWGSYFSGRTDSEVEYNDSRETVRATLVSPVDKATVTTAASSLAAQGDFTINGNSASDCSSDRFTDSYNSSNTDDDYCTQYMNGATGNEGDIEYGGDIDVDVGGGGSDFCGDLVAGGSVIAAATGGSDGATCGSGGGGQPTIYGHINYTDSCTNCGQAVADHSSHDFQVNEIGGLDTIAPINWHIDNQVVEISDAALEDDPGTNQELEAGMYNFSTLSVAGGDTLTLNTSDGDIDIAVHERMDLGNGATIEVTGDNAAYVYVDGSGIGSANHLEMADGATITTPNDNSTQFRIYGKDDFAALLGGGGGGNLAKFTGVIYAPPGAKGDGEVIINGAELFGGLLTGTTTIPSGGTGSIHYDEALQKTNVLKPGSKVVRVTYLHVTINEINVNT